MLFLLLKNKDFYQTNKKIIDDFKKKPGLFHISKKQE